MIRPKNLPFKIVVSRHIQKTFLAPAKGWHPGSKPVAAQGTAANVYAAELDHPRWLYVLPNGDTLVAETNAPPKPEDGKGIKGWIMKRVMRRAGAGSPTANRITLLRDVDGDGVAETRSVFLEGLNSPSGMALVGNDFYMANTDAVMRFPYNEGETRITAPGIKVIDLPIGPINQKMVQGHFFRRWPSTIKTEHLANPSMLPGFSC
jgi:glucose/arabinose dehydrogenase